MFIITIICSIIFQKSIIVIIICFIVEFIWFANRNHRKDTP